MHNQLSITLHGIRAYDLAFSPSWRAYLALIIQMYKYVRRLSHSDTILRSTRDLLEHDRQKQQGMKSLLTNTSTNGHQWQPKLDFFYMLRFNSKRDMHWLTTKQNQEWLAFTSMSLRFRFHLLVHHISDPKPTSAHAPIHMLPCTLQFIVTLYWHLKSQVNLAWWPPGILFHFKASTASGHSCLYPYRKLFQDPNI